jgi:hypothetical protein
MQKIYGWPGNHSDISYNNLVLSGLKNESLYNYA